MFGIRKGQGATEYLVLLAVVLVIALVSIALLGVFPSFSTDTKINQSKTYWQAASPISIVDVGAASGGTLTVIMRNAGPDTIIIANGTATLTPSGTAVPMATLLSSTLGAGATTTATFGIPACTTGQLVEYDMVFSYNTASLTGINQTGSRPVSLKCS